MSGARSLHGRPARLSLGQALDRSDPVLCVLVPLMLAAVVLTGSAPLALVGAAVTWTAVLKGLSLEVER